MVEDMPFEVGQLAESKSFISGYRGAWFRCKINDIKQKSGDMSFALEYFDFPDEKLTSTKLYQWGVARVANGKRKKKQLMVRPCFPTVYRRSDKPNGTTISEVAIVANDEWKVGDLVDWWTDSCFWSGTVTKILSDKKLQIELLPPPEGEGSCYEVSSADLRPSLNWSPESGWSVPVPTMANGCSHPCAQIITPFSKGRLSGNNMTEARGDDIDVTAAGRPMNGSCGPPGDGKIASTDPSSSDSIAAAAASAKTTTTVKVEDNGDDDNLVSSQKKLKAADYAIHLNSKSCDTIENAILDLEGLINHVTRLERILKFGVSYHPEPWKKISKNWASPIRK